MFLYLTLFALFPAHLTTAQECTFGDVAYRRESHFVDPINDNPSTSYSTVGQNAHSSDDCSHFTADFGYHGRKCTVCGVPDSHKEYQGGFVVRAASETEFGRELLVARADLLDVGFVDDEGNRVEEKTMDWTLFPELDCTCEGETVDADKGTCPSPLVYSTSAPTEYGSLSVTQTSATVGNIATLQTNVSIVHTALEGTAFFAVAVPLRFKTSEEENGSFLMEKSGARILFDTMCGDNAVSIVSIEESEEPRGIDLMEGRAVFPQHNLVTFHLDGDNATCDWSYAVELQLEEANTAGHLAVGSTVTFLAMLGASLLL
jgi:hypothetical protein